MAGNNYAESASTNKHITQDTFLERAENDPSDPHDPRFGEFDEAGQGAGNTTPMADLPEPMTPGHQRLLELVRGNDEARAALIAFRDQCVTEALARQAAKLLPPGRRFCDIVESVDRETRDAEFAILIDRMQSASAEVRDLLILQARNFHSADESLVMRQGALHLFHRSYCNGLTKNACGEIIARDIDRRIGVTILSTGNKERDRVIDKIILCGGSLSASSIRRMLK